MVAAEQMALFARARPRRRLCPACGYVHAGMDARAVGRFESGGPAGYRAAYDGAPLRATRSAAVQDMCAARRRRQAAEAATPEGGERDADISAGQRDHGLAAAVPEGGEDRG